MLRYFLTGSAKPNEVSTVKQSLGGFVSGVPVGNDTMNNIFENSYTKDNNRNYKMIVLKNDGGSSVTLLSFALSTTSTEYQYRLSLVEPGTDDCNRKFFESIPDKNSSPFYADFTQNPSNVVIAAGGILGIWLERRKIDEDEVIVVEGNCNCIELLNNFEVFEEKTENFSLIINY